MSISRKELIQYSYFSQRAEAFCPSLATFDSRHETIIHSFVYHGPVTLNTAVHFICIHASQLSCSLICINIWLAHACISAFKLFPRQVSDPKCSIKTLRTKHIIYTERTGSLTLVRVSDIFASLYKIFFKSLHFINFSIDLT